LGAVLHWREGITFLAMLPSVIALIVQQQLAARARGITTWNQMPPLRLRLVMTIFLVPTFLVARLAGNSAYPLVLAAGAMFVGEPLWRAVWRHHESHSPPSPAPAVLPQPWSDVPPSGEAATPWPSALIPAVAIALLLVFALSFGFPALAFALLIPLAPGIYRSRNTRGHDPVATTAIALALGFFIVRLLLPGLALRTVTMRSAAMEPTIGAHQRVLFNRTGIGGLTVGDIVAFRAPQDARRRLCGPAAHTIRPGGAACVTSERRHKRTLYIRRIVAQPGDLVAIVNGHVIRNGVREADPYTQPCGTLPQCNFPIPIKIPRGTWFLLGDNRRESEDSRFFGAIPRSWIIGPALIRTWPLDHVGGL
jgi:signal peptidase I